MKNKKKMWERMSVISATLLAVTIALSNAGTIMEGQLNEMLGLKNYELVTENADPNENTTHFEQLKNENNIEEYYRDVNVAVESEGLVLLKNENNALPLDKNSKVSLALSGSASIFYATHGPGVRLEDGLIDLKTALEEEAGFQINEELYSYYKGKGATLRIKTQIPGGKNLFLTNEKDWSVYPPNVKNSFAQYGDAAIAVISRISGEGDDVSAFGSDGWDGSYLSLTKEERSVLEALAEKKEKGEIDKIVVLLNSAMTVQCDFLYDEALGIDAAMWIGLPGGTGTRAVAQALVGDVNPSGRLSDTFLKDNFSNPAAEYWRVNEGFASMYTNANEWELNNTQKYYGVYVENIYVGYRYYETRYEDYVMQAAGVGAYDYNEAVAYPFGYGMSYTSFEYSDMQVSELDEDGNYTVKVTVDNTGTRPGKEVVQIYLQKPYTDYDKSFGVEKASVELVGFAKTKMLDKGESETVEIKVAKESFKSYDAENARSYILDAGEYYLTAGKDSHDAINNILAAKAKNGNSMVNVSLMDDAGNAEMAQVALKQKKINFEIYSASTEEAADGTLIENQLDFMDPNRYDGVTNVEENSFGEVTYVSRFDWENTYPSVKTMLQLIDIGEEKYDITSHKTIIEEAGATMPTYGALNGLNLAMMRGKDFDDPDWEKLLDQITEEEMWYFLTGCYGYTPAIPSIVKPLTDEDDGPYGVSNCKEGYSSMSCAGIIASTFNVELFRKIGEAYAADARSNFNAERKNLHGLYSPGINMHRCAFGGRAAEYFSEDPVLSGFAGMHQIQAMQAQGVVAHPKHYIFNDEESQRNGICVWANEQSAREIYLLPWEYALRPSMGNGHAIMTSFNRAGALWTSASDALMMNILRGEWAFDGYALTDMAESNGGLFMTYDDGFMNGTDCFLGRGTDLWQPEWKNSPTFNQKLRDAAHRMLYIFANYSASMNGISVYTEFQPVTVWWKLIINIAQWICIGLTVLSVFMFLIAPKQKKEKVQEQKVSKKPQAKAKR